MYHYLNTLRLHETREGGRTLTVGPGRRVVFRARIACRVDMRKDEVKRILGPLKPYWGVDEPSKVMFRRERDPERPLMTFMQFKLSAKQLLSDAGMLLDRPAED